VIFGALGEDEDRDVERRVRTYVTRKEFLIWIAIGAAVLVAAYFLLYIPWKGNRDFVVSQTNLQAIGKALGIYMAANDDGLPAVYLPGAKDADGHPVTWANQLFGYSEHMDVFHNASNPSAGDTLLGYTDASGERSVVALSYGMLSAASALRKSEIRDETIIFAETIGRGAMGSFDPIPLDGADGFAIGYDDSNDQPTGSSRYATRLAFVSDKDKPDPADLLPLHGERGAVGLRMDGGVSIFPSALPAIKINRRGNLPAGQWVPY
jgi:hypothetical protein